MTQDEMARIADAHDSKAAKVRALHEAGASTSEISDFVGIRYQHTYNVLRRAGRVGGEAAAAAQPDERILALEVGADGSIRLPDDLLAALGAVPGMRMIGRQTSDGLLIIPRDAAVAELQRIVTKQIPGQAALLQVLLGDPSPAVGDPGKADK